MKRGIIFISLIVIILFLISFINAVPPPIGIHIDRCNIIDNLNDFPEVVLIGKVNIDCFFIIPNNRCIRSGITDFYDNLKIYLADNNSVNRYPIKNGCNIFNKSLISTFYALNITLKNDEFIPTSINNKNHYYIEYNNFSIIGFSKNNTFIFQSSRITNYSNGTTKVESFEKPSIPNLRITFKETPTPTPTPTPTTTQTTPPLPPNPPNTITPEATQTPTPTPISPQKKTFFQSIGCFFTKLFGGKC